MAKYIVDMEKLEQYFQAELNVVRLNSGKGAAAERKAKQDYAKTKIMVVGKEVESNGNL